MATSPRYDEFEDPGLAFTEDELSGYDMQVFAEERIARLMRGIVQPAKRRTELNLQYPAFCRMLARDARSIVTWYGQALELPSIRTSVDELLERGDQTTAEAKRITKAAQQMDFDELLTKWEVNALSQMRYVVTIGRRCSGATKISGWTKADKSRSNKLANCVNRELHAVEKLRTQLEARK